MPHHGKCLEYFYGHEIHDRDKMLFQGRVQTYLLQLNPFQIFLQNLLQVFGCWHTVLKVILKFSSLNYIHYKQIVRILINQYHKRHRNYIIYFIKIYIKMPKCLEHFEGGNKDSQEFIVFLQGWPDNAEMWNWLNWKEDLSDKHLLFINFPNTNGKVDVKWGQDFPQLIQDLKFTIDSLKVASKNKMLVCHDWGCFYGYMFDQKYPQFFKELITLDVPGKVQLKSIKQVFYVALYQITLAIAFLIGGPIGKIISQSLMKLFKHNPPYAQQVNSSQNYPYYYLYRNFLLSSLKLKPRYLQNYRPSVPCTYLYGAVKPFQFHGEKWLQMVKESGGEVHRMEAGHWFMKKYSKFIVDLINRRLKAKL